MQGNNTLILNASTMMEATQDYLAKIMVNAPTVTSVKQDYSSGLFTVEVTSPTPVPET